MAPAVDIDLTEGEIPPDAFRVRIAMVRAMRGWNVKQAAEACGLSPENWRMWEKTGRRPQDYETVCRRIAEGSGFSKSWISSGGPLATSRCFALHENDADYFQGVLAFERDLGLA
jgi:transcriptional regulator with XRE-family HTH domain